MSLSRSLVGYNYTKACGPYKISRPEPRRHGTPRLTDKPALASHASGMEIHKNYTCTSTWGQTIARGTGDTSVTANLEQISISIGLDLWLNCMSLELINTQHLELGLVQTNTKTLTNGKPPMNIRLHLSIHPTVSFARYQYAAPLKLVRPIDPKLQ